MSKLKQAQDEYNTYYKEVVLPQLNLSAREQERIGFVELNELIKDQPTRRQHAQLAITLLQENLEECRADATLLPTPDATPLLSTIALLLSVAALANAFYGMTAALSAAALVAWYLYWQDQTSLPNRRREAEQHNIAAQDWIKTCDDWRKDIVQLQRS